LDLSDIAKPDYLTDEEWEERLRLMAQGRQLVDIRPSKVSAVGRPAIRRQFHLAKSLEEVTMDITFTPIEKGVSSAVAEPFAKRAREIADTLLSVAKTVEDRVGEDGGEGLGEDVTDVLSRLGLATIDAGITVEKAEMGVPAPVADAVIKKLSAYIEEALSIRRIVQERKGGPGAETAKPPLGVDILDRIRKLEEGLGSIRTGYGAPGKAAAEPPEEPKPEDETEKGEEGDNGVADKVDALEKSLSEFQHEVRLYMEQAGQTADALSATLATALGYKEE
jgi:hypothetical protein